MTEDQNFEKEEEAPTREEIIEECASPAEEPAVAVAAPPPEAPAKVKKPRAKAKPTITKEEIVLAVLEATKPPPKPDKPDKNKELVLCPDCGLTITYHNLRYTHKRYCKGNKEAALAPTPPVPTAPGLERSSSSTAMSDELVNLYIKNNPELVTSFLRNERANKANKRQVNAKALLVGAL